MAADFKRTEHGMSIPTRTCLNFHAVQYWPIHLDQLRILWPIKSIRKAWQKPRIVFVQGGRLVNEKQRERYPMEPGQS